MLPVAATLASDVGNVRPENQDRAVIARGKDKTGQNYILLVVADGIGGMKDGAMCASLATGVFISTLHKCAQTNLISHDWLKYSIRAANQAVYEEFRGDGGSTLVAILLRPGKIIHWLSVGDSRVYSFNGKSLAQISVDDTIAGQLNTNENNSDHSRLLQFVGAGFDLEPHVAQIQNAEARALLLTTDGVHYLTRMGETFLQILIHAPDIGSGVRRLMELAKWCGGSDNGTVGVVDLLALSDEMFESKLESTVLELWDPFGEIQFVDEHSYDLNIREKSGFALPNKGGYGNSIIKDKIKKSSPNYLKKGNVNKKKEAVKKGQKRRSEIPQLNIEFSSKDNKD